MKKRDTRYRFRKLGTQALEKVLKKHDPWCKMHTWEKLCTCGRNQAIAELRVLQRGIQEVQGKETFMLWLQRQSKADPRYAVTEAELKQMVTEYRLSKYLERLLSERPEVSLKSLLVSQKVQENVSGLLQALTEDLEQPMTMHAECDVRKGRRRVWVTIDPKVRKV